MTDFVVHTTKGIFDIKSDSFRCDGALIRFVNYDDPGMFLVAAFSAHTVTAIFPKTNDFDATYMTVK